MVRASISSLLGKITAIVVICCFSLPVQGKYGGGKGEPNDPYLICTAEQMNAIGADSNDWDKHFKLMADIDLSVFTGTSFNIIGYYVNDSDNAPFTGVFDGNDHSIQCFTYSSTGRNSIAIFGFIEGEESTIHDLQIYDPNVDGGTARYVAALVGRVKYGSVIGCYVEGGSVSGHYYVAGLVGRNSLGIVSNCFSSACVLGSGHYIGGLVGYNSGIVTYCFAIGDVVGYDDVGGLVGSHTMNVISNCYSMGSVSGDEDVGGLVGYNVRPIVNCYSTGSVSGRQDVGGLVGTNMSQIANSFWDIEASGVSNMCGIDLARPSVCNNANGKTTGEMQVAGTFKGAGWDFNTPIWKMCDVPVYPKLWWEQCPLTAPVLHAEPVITLGISNTISWEPIAGDVEYYAECSEDANFTNIIYNSGWITETSYEFTGLELGKRYWYSLKARNSAGIESQWSNVESSLQCTLADAVDIMLDPNNLKSEHLKKPYIHKINIAQEMIDAGIYTGALSKLKNDILPKTDGCAETGEPDKSDWVITCEQQAVVYPLIIETIEYVKGFME